MTEATALATVENTTLDLDRTLRVDLTLMCALAPNIRPPVTGRSGLFHTGGPDVPVGLMSDDGTLYPIALWGRSSL